MHDTTKYHPVLAVARAFIETIREAGPDGAPAGAMYLAFMERGGTLEQFEQIMQAITSTGLIRKVNNCYVVVKQ